MSSPTSILSPLPQSPSGASPTGVKSFGFGSLLPQEQPQMQASHGNGFGGSGTHQHPGIESNAASRLSIATTGGARGLPGLHTALPQLQGAFTTSRDGSGTSAQISPKVWSPSQGLLLDMKPSGIAFFAALDRQAQLHGDASNLPESPSEVRFAAAERSSRLASPTGLERRMTRALARKGMLLQEKKMRLAHKTEWIRHRVLMAKQTGMLRRLRNSAKADFAMASAYLKRQLLIQEKVERHARHVAYAHNVSLMKKIDRAMALRKSVSTTFAELIERADFLEVAAEQEFETEEEAGDVSASPVLGTVEEIEAAEQELAQRLIDETTAAAAALLSGAKTPATKPSSPSQMKKSLSVPDLLDETSDNPKISLAVVFGDAQPPITRFSLAELDIKSVLRDWQVRHDMVFDPDLCFKPNTAGPRGELKRQKKELFWAKVARGYEQDYTQVLVLINEVKAIILDLAPWKDSFVQEIEDKIDIRLIDGQLKHGVFDFKTFLTYLAKTLQSLCAPFRDPEVDKITLAADAADYLGGLKQAFNLLEFMKLDIVNRNLVKLRPWVIEQAAEFELAEFQDRLTTGELAITNTNAWLSAALPKVLSATPNEPIENVFATAFMELVRDNSMQDNYPLPETLLMDKSRIVSYYSQWEDLAILACVLMIFKQALGGKGGAGKEKELKEANARLQVLLEDKDTCMDHMYLEITAQAGKIRGKDFSEQETNAIKTMLEKTLSPGSKVYELMVSRIGIHMTAFLKSKDGRFDDAELRKHGLSELSERMVALVLKIKTLMDHNKDVFKDVYSEIGKAAMQRYHAAVQASAASSAGAAAAQGGQNATSSLK